MTRNGRGIRFGPAATLVTAAGVFVGLGLWATGGAAGAPISLTQRVLRSGEITGFVVKSPPALVFDAKAFAAQLAAPNEAGHLRRAGFTRGVFERLTGPSGARAFSLLYAYRTARAARSEMSRLYGNDVAVKGATTRALPVPGIPGARGLVTLYKQGAPQAQVEWYFTEGRYVYFGTAIGPHVASAGFLAPFVRASARLYARVHGR